MKTNKTNNTNQNGGADEEPPPVLKTWKNLYFLVLGNLLLWIALFTLFTWMFK